MSALRRISTRHLLAICAVTVLAAIGVTAVAMAMGGGGPKPPPKPLAHAVHDAAHRPNPAGVSARIKFTNNLVDASSIQGADPLLAGAKGRLWASPEEGGNLRLELQSKWRRRHAGARHEPAIRDLRRGLGNRLPGTLPKKAGTARTPAPGARCRDSVKSKRRSPKPKSTPC